MSEPQRSRNPWTKPHLSPPNTSSRPASLFWPAKTLLSAVELGVFTELAKHPEPLDSLSARLGIHPRGARDFADTLVSLGFLQRDEAGVYANTPETELFLDKAKPSYIGGMLEMANHRLYPFWGHLTEALKTGIPQNEASKNPDFFAELYADPARLHEFLSAMTGVSRAANLAIARCPDIDWPNRRRFVDAGTAQGDLALQIALANPHLQGAGFDLPQVAPIFEDYIEKYGVGDRVHFEAGSFFDVPCPRPTSSSWDTSSTTGTSRRKKSSSAKPTRPPPVGGIFVIYDTLIDDDRRENSFGLMMSLNMLVETPGGFDYTGADGIGWVREAGFREAKVIPLQNPSAIIVAMK